MASALVPTPSMAISTTGTTVFLPRHVELCEAEYWAEGNADGEGSMDASHDDNTGNDVGARADVGGGDGDDSVTNSQQEGDGGMDFER